MRRRAVAIAAFILVWLGCAHGQGSDVQVERLGGDAYRLVLKSFRSSTVGAGQQELLPTAQQVCSGKGVHYGHYAFERNDPITPGAAPGPLVLRQEIQCGGAEPAPSNTTTAGDHAQWRPTAEQQEAVDRLTRAYFSARDGGRFDEAYAMFSNAQQAAMPFENWRSQMATFYAKAGEVQNRTIKKTTWYKDPPGTPPGVYAAADFASHFANIDIHCGYVVWHEQPDGSFRLIREEEGYIERDVQLRLPPSELRVARSKVGC